MKRPDSLRIQILIFCGGTIISLAAIFFVGAEKVSFADAADYMSAANALLTNFTYPNGGTLPFFRPPFYPFFIALIWLVFPASILAIKIAQAIIFGLTCVLIYKIAFALINRRLPALLASLACMLNPFIIIQTTDIQTETVHTFLVAFAVLLLVKILAKKEEVLFSSGTVWKIFAAGIFIGFAALCRPSALPIGIALGAGVVLLKYREIKFTGSLVVFAAMICGIFLAIFPWTLANWYRTHELILINDIGGYAMWVGNVPEILPVYEGNFRDSVEFNRYADHVNVDLAFEKMNEWESTVGYSNLSLKQREALWQAEAVKNARENPGLTVRLVFEKAWAFWKPYLNPSAYSAKVAVVSGVFLVALYLLSLYGAKVVWQDIDGKRAIILLGILFLSATVVHALIIGMIRYRIPYVDPYLCVLAGIGVTALWDKAGRILPGRSDQKVN
jgi:4-amino-4-deoxy-L-arabinose transferase-like glycosyltransferase